MEIPVLIEPVEGKGYRASVFSIVAEGTTKEETLANLKTAIGQRLAAGGEIASITIPMSRPWMAYAGTWDPDDLRIAEWWEEVEKFRRERDNEAEQQEMGE